MRLFIPPLGTKLRLIKPWQFALLCEDRNKTLWDLIAYAPMHSITWQHQRSNLCTVTLLPGDELTVDRIFIRKGSKQYDSVTFKGKVFVDGVYHKCRFWVKLADTLNLDVEIVS